MAGIEWTKDFVIGNNKIDLQHMELMNIYNALLAETKKGEGNLKIKEYLKKLADYTSYHFDTEEKYFEEINYPFLNIQKKEHLNFKKKIIELVKDYQSKKIRINMDILDFLKNWINDHIINEDCRARDYISSVSEIDLQERITGIDYNIYGEGKTIFFIHDNIHSSKYFADILHLYQKRYKVVTFDLPGCGKSTADIYQYGDYWDDSSTIIDRICKKHKLKDIVLFSYGFGSYVALNTAYRFPELVKGIVLNNPQKPVFEKEDLKSLLRERAKCVNSSDSFFFSRMHGDKWQEVIESDNRLFSNLKNGKKTFFPHNRSDIKCQVNVFYSMKKPQFERISKFNEFLERITDSRIIFENYSEDPLFLKSPQKFFTSFEKIIKDLFSQNAS